MKIFGVSIGNEKRRDVFLKIENALFSQRDSLFILTLNNEILLKAAEDEQYKNILNNADMRIIDSVGIKIVSLLKRSAVGERMAGADIARHILEKAIEKKLSVGVVSKVDGFSNEKDIKNALINCPNLVVVPKDINDNQIEDDIKKLAGVEILLVGLGAPHQEKYIWNIKNSLPKLKIAIGVGGTLDYWTGKKIRAPKIIRKAGLEWTWRFIIQPNRALRIWNATAVFLWKALIS